MFESWSPSGGTVWEELGSVTLLEECDTEGVGFEASKARAISSHAEQAVRPQLLPQCHECLPAAMIPVMMATDSPSEALSLQ